MTPKALEYFKRPFKYENAGQTIYCDSPAGKSMALQVRGWGNLTGGGGCKLNTKEAAVIQDEFGQWVADTLNEYDRRVTELLEANNRLVEQCREARRLLVTCEKTMEEAQNYIVKELLNKPALLAEEVELVTQAVTCAAETFRWYEKMHREKPDHEKADRNRDFAVVMENALAVLEGKSRTC